MKFWRGNKIDAEFDMEPSEVAAAFYRDLMADKHDLRQKWAFWPRTRVVLDWMTAPDCFNAAWEDRRYIELILDVLEATAPPGSLGICPECGGEYPVTDDGTMAEHEFYPEPLEALTKGLSGRRTAPCKGRRPSGWRF